MAEAIESLWHKSIKGNDGIEDTIRTLDVKLSESIMHAMENGMDLEKKVSTFLCPIFLFADRAIVIGLTSIHARNTHMALYNNCILFILNAHLQIYVCVFCMREPNLPDLFCSIFLMLLLCSYIYTTKILYTTIYVVHHPCVFTSL